jgi:hypothetical protein
MRLLAAIPHYYQPPGASSTDGRSHGSLADPPGNRAVALSYCIAALHQLYGPSQHIIEQVTRVAHPANMQLAGQVDVIVCTTGQRHVLDHLMIPADSYIHHPTNCPPPFLGFECHAVLRERLGDYEYYAYLEDDLIARSLAVRQAGLVHGPARRWRPSPAQPFRSGPAGPRP